MILDIITDDKNKVLNIGYICDGKKQVHSIKCKDEWYNLCTDEKGLETVSRDDLNNLSKKTTTKKKKVQPVLLLKNWDGRRLFKVYEDTLCTQRIYDIIWDLPEDILNDILSETKYRICFCDIETDISPDGFVDPTVASMPITTISMMIKNKVVVLGTRPLITKQNTNETQSDVCVTLKDRLHKHLNDTNIEFGYLYYNDELTMLKSFLNILNKSVDILTGWNFTGFDWLYIYNRLGNIMGSKRDADVLLASASICNELVNMSISNLSGARNYAKRPANLFIFDYIKLFESFPPTNLSSYALDNVGEMVCGIKKVSYEGSLKDLYINDYNTYVLYNAIDSCLVSKIHDKRKCLDLGIYQAVVAKCSIDRILSKTSLAERLMAWEFRKDNKRLAGIPKGHKKQKTGKYEGAYVKDPKVGFYLDVTCNDFASLYPNMIRTYNISPETLIGKYDENDVVFKKIKSESNYIITDNNTVFKKETGCLNTIMTNLFNSRKSTKKLSQQCDTYINLIKKMLDNDVSDKEVEEFLNNSKLDELLQ